MKAKICICIIIASVLVTGCLDIERPYRNNDGRNYAVFRPNKDTLMCRYIESPNNDWGGRGIDCKDYFTGDIYDTYQLSITDTFAKGNYTIDLGNRCIHYMECINN